MADELGAVRDALRSPVEGPALRDSLRAGRRVAIAVCDGTRPQPRRPMLAAVLEEIAGTVDLDDVVVLVATGHPPWRTRRPSWRPCSARNFSPKCAS